MKFSDDPRWEAYIQAAQNISADDPPGGFAGPPFLLAVRIAKTSDSLQPFDRKLFTKAWIEVGMDPDYRSDPDYMRALKSGIWDAEEEAWLRKEGHLRERGTKMREQGDKKFYLPDPDFKPAGGLHVHTRAAGKAGRAANAAQGVLEKRDAQVAFEKWRITYEHKIPRSALNAMWIAFNRSYMAHSGHSVGSHPTATWPETNYSTPPGFSERTGNRVKKFATNMPPEYENPYVVTGPHDTAGGQWHVHTKGMPSQMTFFQTKPEAEKYAAEMNNLHNKARYERAGWGEYFSQGRTKKFGVLSDDVVFVMGFIKDVVIPKKLHQTMRLQDLSAWVVEKTGKAEASVRSAILESFPDDTWFSPRRLTIADFSERTGHRMKKFSAGGRGAGTGYEYALGKVAGFPAWPAGKPYDAWEHYVLSGDQATYHPDMFSGAAEMEAFRRGFFQGWKEGATKMRASNFSERTGHRMKKFGDVINLPGGQANLWVEGEEVPAGVWPSKEWHQQKMYDAASKAGRKAGMGAFPLREAWDAWERENGAWLRDSSQPGGSADYTKLWKAFEYAFLNAPTSRYSSDFSERTGNRTKKFYGIDSGGIFDQRKEIAWYAGKDNGYTSGDTRLSKYDARRRPMKEQWGALVNTRWQVLTRSPEGMEELNRLRLAYEDGWEFGKRQSNQDRLPKPPPGYMYSERTGHRTKKFVLNDPAFPWSSGKSKPGGHNPPREDIAFEMGEAWGVRIWAIITGMEFEGHRTPDFERRVNPDDEYGIEHQWAFFIRENPEARSWSGIQKSAWGRGYSTKVKGFSQRTPHRFVAPRGLFG